MVKVALLIGVSEYGPGLTALPMALKNVESMQRVLQHAEMGGFDEVKTLVNPNPPLMRKAIEALCSERTQDDFVVLFFSGYS
ncbi:MAG: caspase family protein, partial [Merismopedia sp. SIO2A8]|nr:caspase family protein [Merismopedia sp. SIO2A8]